MLLEINQAHPQPRTIAKVVETLKQGGVIAYPTDTSYAIGCDIEQRKSHDRVYGVRKRGSGKPLTLICADIEMIARYAVINNQAFRTLRGCLPGPYTFILPATPTVPKTLIPKRREVGVRIPDNPICLAIVKELGRPLVSGTAQFGEDPPMADPYEVNEAFSNSVEVVIDGGLLQGGYTTVVSLLGEAPDVIRQGLGSSDCL